MSEPRSFLNGRVTLHAGDCRDVLKGLADNSVDSVVTDPPYHLTSIVKRFGKSNLERDEFNLQLPSNKGGGGTVSPYKRAAAGFMGKQWDGGNIAFQPELWAEVLRVLKPGGYAIIFGGTRTAHRMVCAIEDAGFEIRDEILLDKDSETEYRVFEESLSDEQRRQFGKLFRERGTGRLSWQFGVGFPKSKNINTCIDRCLCALPLASSLQVTGVARAILQPDMLRNGEAKDTNLRSLRESVGTEDAQTWSERENLFEGMREQTHINSQDWNSIATQPETDGCLPSLWNGEDNSSGVDKEGQEQLLQPVMSSEGACCSTSAVRGEWKGQETSRQGNGDGTESCVEGWRDAQEAARELQRSPLCEGADMGARNGTEGSLHHGASIGDGSDVRIPSYENGSRQPRGPQSGEQPSEQSDSLSDEFGSQARGSWPICGRCGKPIIPEGLGTALKPAHEPICLARKPISEKSIAQNVLKWGTGAINVGACRVGVNIDHQAAGLHRGSGSTVGSFTGTTDFNQGPHARWPANLLHDGSEEVLACFPESGPTAGVKPPSYSRGMTSGNVNDGWRRPAHEHYEDKLGGFSDSGSAAHFFASFPQEDVQRIFYTSKAGADDRLGSRHPTIKPLDLIQYLVRLITPKNGTCLDLFAGTGTLGEAAFREGFNSILIEKELEYVSDIEKRLSLVMSGPDERRRESIKKRGQAESVNSLPLFGGV
jgi:DNA modification methylase